ncbi:MAG: hypothetical protein CTY25_13435 [Methylobacterium sp.]|nr:MAG: hypothetical protein CTY25_13435 [Methylobacterium sp.]
MAEKAAMVIISHPWKDNPLEYLMRIKFPLERAYTAPFVSISSRNLPMRDDAYVERAIQYRAEQVAREEAQKAVERRNAEENNLFFSRPESNADVMYWSRMSLWTLEDATALSFGKDPRKVSWEKLKNYDRVSPFPIKYKEQYELFHRAKLAGQLWDSTIPRVFLAWARRMRVAMPQDLIAAVEDLGIQIADWKTLFDNQEQETQTAIAKKEAELNELRQRIAELTTNTLGSAPPSPVAEKSLGIRERESLLKLVIGMAVNGYGYDPKAGRSDKIREIAGDLERLGIALDVDTVRKYVNEGRGLLPPPETEQKR